MFHTISWMLLVVRGYIFYFIKFDFLSIWSSIHQNNSKIQSISNLCYFVLPLKCLLSYQRFCNFSLYKSCRIDLGSMLLPDGRNWQLIYPDCQPKCLICDQALLKLGTKLLSLSLTAPSNLVLYFISRLVATLTRLFLNGDKHTSLLCCINQSVFGCMSAINNYPNQYSQPIHILIYFNPFLFKLSPFPVFQMASPPFFC